LFWPWQTVADDVVKAAGWDGSGLTVTATVRALLVPHALVAVTLSVPEVALFEKLTVTAFVVPVIVAPAPE
jgi:hypothetical protein